MKKVTFILAAIAALFSTNAAAQLENDTEGYQRFEASFVANKMTFESKQDNKTASSDAKTKGFELGFVKGISLTNQMPLFLELGGNFTFTHRNDEEEIGIASLKVSYKYKNTYASIGIPVDVAYKISFTNSNNFTIVPFVGPNFKFNLIGKSTVESGDNKTEINYFDKDDMGGSDSNTAKRFQIGLNAGLGVNIAKKLYVGYRFQPDFTRYYKVDDDNYCKSATNYLTLGLNF